MTSSGVAELVIRTTCPRDCYDGCGILVSVVDGRIRHVRGDPAHPVARGKLCRKCTMGYNGVFLDPAVRLTTPLRRVGAKGEGRWEAIGWDEALALVAERLGAIAAGPGAHTVLNAHYTGTLSLVASSFPQRLLGRYGATEVDPDTVCNKAGHVALGYLYGDSEIGFDPRTIVDAACVVVWGANPSACGPHQQEHFLGASPGPVIVVDPIRTDTAAAADIHVQLRPGSDAALAFAMMHVAHRDGLLDRDYIDAHTVGFAELEPAIIAATPAWAAAETDVEESLIESVARLYARGPSLLWLGQGLQRQPLGGNIFRAVATLPAITGNLARPGAGFCYMNSGSRVGVDYDMLAAAHLAADAPEAISQMDLAAVLEDRTRSSGLVTWQINIAQSSPEQARLRDAMRRDDLFHVAIDLFGTDTTDLADVVLPAASFLEFDDLVAPYFDIALAVQAKAADPPGLALPNQEIFRRLASAMGFTEPELHEDDRSIIAAVLAASGTGESFASLAAKGTVRPHPDVLLQFADGAFDTPSGRIELASDAAEADGHPRVPQPTVDARPAPGWLRLLTPASAWTMNGTFANDPKAARKFGPAIVELHAEDAAARGIADGDTVDLVNATGSLRLQAVLTGRVPRGTALSAKGRWPRRETTDANVNALNHGAKTDMGESSAVHGVEVEVRRVS
jgi:anaerobic selenocysteine-containing dehydrogenase